MKRRANDLRPTDNATDKRVRVAQFGYCALAVLLLCAPFFKFEYATDTYTIINVGFKAFGDSMYRNGRLITALLFYLFDSLSLDIVIFYGISFLISLFFAALAVYTLYRILLNYLSSLPAFLFSLLTLLNPLSVEYFLFLEKGCFLFAICMSVMALKYFLKVTDTSQPQLAYLPLACLFVTLSAFVYQPLPGVFAALAVLFIALRANTPKRFLCDTLLAIGVYGSGMLLEFLFLKLFGGSARMSTKIHLSNIERALSMPFSQLLPLALLAIFLLFGVCYLSQKLRKQELEMRKVLTTFFKSAYLLIGTVAVTLLPLVLVAPEEVWLPFRIAYPIGLLIGTLPLFFLCHGKEKSSTVVCQPIPSFPPRVLTAVLCALVLANYAFFQAVMISRLKNNALDEKLCLAINEEIVAYESQSGVTVTTVCIYYDEAITTRHSGVLSFGDANVRAFAKDWSDVHHMNVILDRSFAECVPDAEVYRIYFEGKDWDTYHPDQLVFLENTLHLCVY